MSDPILATLTPSTPRRIIGAGLLMLLGAMMLWVVVTTPPRNPGWLVFLILAGAGAFWLAVRTWQSTSVRLELTRSELRDSRGRVLARMAEVRAIDRGVFAFKPSSGFLLRLESSAPAVWLPGLWWRLGRSLGVGGVTGRDEGKYMAEVIAMMLADRAAADRDGA